MPKELYEMSIEELWTLFLIRLTAHQEECDIWQCEEYEILSRQKPYMGKNIDILLECKKEIMYGGYNYGI